MPIVASSAATHSLHRSNPDEEEKHSSVPKEQPTKSSKHESASDTFEQKENPQQQRVHIMSSNSSSTPIKQKSDGNVDQQMQLLHSNSESLTPLKSPSGKSLSTNHPMTLEAIRKICKSRKDLYENLELNEKLFLNFSGFTSINCLDSFPQLKSLWLQNNLLTTLQSESPSAGLMPCTQLKCLYLQNNLLTSLAGIECLANSLVLLNVSGNKLTSLAGIASLQHLQILDAHDNSISDISELNQMTNQKYLHTLDLSQNQIGTGFTAAEEDDHRRKSEEGDENLPSHQQPVAPVFEMLSRLPQLKVIYLKHNPLVEKTTQYRRILSSLMPSLRFLDDRPVSELDKACAVAWKAGGQERERSVRTLTLQERREKEERNMKQWMKQKEERVQQLAELRKQQEAAAAEQAAAAASGKASPENVQSSDPHLTKRVYHSSTAPIPASPYHGEIAAVEYSSWLIKQEEIESEEQAQREADKQEQLEELERKAKQQANKPVSSSSPIVTTFSSSSSSSSSAMAVDPVPTSSYFDTDSNDDPEIAAMKSMLHEVLLSTRALTVPRPAGSPSSAATGKKKSSNIGVSEADLVDEAQLEKEAAEHAQAKLNALKNIPNLVHPNKNDAAHNNVESVADAAESNVSSGATTPTGTNVAPNNFSILENKSIADIYEETKFKLPSVSMSDSEHEDDVSDEDEEEAVVEPDILEGSGSMADRLVSPTSASSTSSSASARKKSPRLPKILGFGPDDAHLINRPFLGRGDGAVGAGEIDELDDGWFPGSTAAASSATATTATTASASPAKTATPSKNQSLAEMLESRRSARLGSAHKPVQLGSNAKSSKGTASRGTAVDHSDLEGPSSQATGVTAQSLLTSFIQAQFAPTPSLATSSSAADAAASSPSREQVARSKQLEREQKNELFVRASEQLEHKHTFASEDDEDDDVEDDDENSSESAEEESVPIDPRAAAIEARRLARQGGR